MRNLHKAGKSIQNLTKPRTKLVLRLLGQVRNIDMLKKIKSELKERACKKHGEILAKFFQTHKGGYGEGDIFLGVRMPEIRKIAKKYNEVSLTLISKLLHSKIHEERMCAVVMLVNKFKKADVKEQEKIYKLYLKSIKKCVNNWDLVDVSAPHIVGAYLYTHPAKWAKSLLAHLAGSRDLWERRVAIIATQHFIKHGKFKESLYISQILLNDEHDLIHKAVGWMLREVGKKNMIEEEKFLKKHYKKMPRTMLRYAIEKFPEHLRKRYLLGKI